MKSGQAATLRAMTFQASADFELGDHLEAGVGRAYSINKGAAEWRGKISIVIPYNGFDPGPAWQKWLDKKYGSGQPPTQELVTMNSAARIALACLLLRALTAPSLVSGADRDSLEPEVIQEFDIVNDGYALLAPVEVNGTRRLIMLDTGCSRAIYDESLRPLLGKPVRSASASSLSAAFRAQLFHPPAARLGMLDLHPNDHGEEPLVACLDLSRFRRALDADLTGIIGREFLKRHVVRLDFDHGKLQFLTAPGDDAGIRLPIRFVKNIPLIRVELPSVGGTYFQFDTGLTGDSGSLHVDHVRYLEKYGQLTPIGTTQMAEVERTQETRTLRLASLKLYQFEHHDLIFQEHSGNVPSSLGLGYCIRYITTFDLGNSAVYLKPSKRFARREKAPHNNGSLRFGLEVERQGGKAIISLIKRGGPAEKAGLSPSDVLLAVNGTDVGGLHRFSILSLFMASSSSVCLTVERAGTRREVLVSLPPPLVLAAPSISDDSAKGMAEPTFAPTPVPNARSVANDKGPSATDAPVPSRPRLGKLAPEKARTK